MVENSAIITYLTRTTDSPLMEIIVNGLISVGMSVALLGLVAVVDKSIRDGVLTMFRATTGMIKGRIRA